MAQNDKALLQRLNDQRVDFVVIVGVCGVLYGVSLVTFDLDICCDFSIANLRRIEAAIKDLHPHHRLVVHKLPFELTDELCARLKNLYLQTDAGVLDCLSEVAGLGPFHQVLHHSIEHNLSYGQFRILTLDALIVSKEAVGRQRDLAAIKQLRSIKERGGQRQ